MVNRAEEEEVKKVKAHSDMNLLQCLHYNRVVVNNVGPPLFVTTDGLYCVIVYSVLLKSVNEL